MRAAHLVGELPASNEQPLPAVNSHHNHLRLEASHRTHTHIVQQLPVQLWGRAGKGGEGVGGVGEVERTACKSPLPPTLRTDDEGRSPEQGRSALVKVI